MFIVGSLPNSYNFWRLVALLNDAFYINCALVNPLTGDTIQALMNCAVYFF